MLVKAQPKDRGALSLGVLKEWFPCSLIRLTWTREVLTLDSGPSPSPALSTLSITGTSIVLNESDFEPLQTFLKLRPMLCAGFAPCIPSPPRSRSHTASLSYHKKIGVWSLFPVPGTES